jgi:predicted RNase H-like HicB family nuclease
VFVALRRHPARAARLAELERAVAQAPTREEARVAAAEVADLLEEAAREIAA